MRSSEGRSQSASTSLDLPCRKRCTEMLTKSAQRRRAGQIHMLEILILGLDSAPSNCCLRSVSCARESRFCYRSEDSLSMCDTVTTESKILRFELTYLNASDDEVAAYTTLVLAKVPLATRQSLLLSFEMEIESERCTR